MTGGIYIRRGREGTTTHEGDAVLYLQIPKVDPTYVLSGSQPSCKRCSAFKPRQGMYMPMHSYGTFATTAESEEDQYGALNAEWERPTCVRVRSRWVKTSGIQTRKTLKPGNA